MNDQKDGGSGIKETVTSVREYSANDVSESLVVKASALNTEDGQ